MSSKSGVRKGVSEAIGLSVLFALVFIFSAPPAVAASEFQGMSACQDATLERTALLAEGRAVPLAVHARRIRKGLLSDTCKSLSDTALYCLLAHGERARLSESLGCKVELKVEHAKLKSLVGMESEAMSAPVAQVEGRRFQLEGDYRGLEANQQLQTGYGVALTRLLNNLKQLSMIESGEDWRVRVSADEWKPKSKFASTAEFFDAVSASERFLSSNEKKAMSHEELYERLHLFPLSALVCIVAFAASIAGGRSPRARQWAMGLAVGLLALEAFTMYLRVVISGRAPVTNMFETVMWTSFGVLTLSVLMSLFNREKAILTLGLAVNMIGLFMLNFATTMLDSSIRPLVPVLRDNFWLSTHVTTVTLAYASFAMSWISANFVLGAFLVGQARGEFIERWNHISRVAMQVGAVLLSAGVILGGVWADYSWGRFWGWDPKETWSLIALMIYIAVLHGKYVGWFKGLRFAMVGAGAFLFVLMAWFGVNYILAAGLHSYGFSNGGAAFLATTFAGQAVILVATYLREIGLRSRGLARASLTSERA